MIRVAYRKSGSSNRSRIAAKSNSVSSRLASICSSATGTEPAQIVLLIGCTCQGERDWCVNFRDGARLEAPASEAADRRVVQARAARSAHDADVGYGSGRIDLKDRDAGTGQALTTRLVRIFG